MEVILRRNQNGGVDISPVSGKFAGTVVAHAEKVYLRYGEPVKYGRPVRLKATHGLTIHDDCVHEDVPTVRALALFGQYSR